MVLIVIIERIVIIVIVIVIVIVIIVRVIILIMIIVISLNNNCDSNSNKHARDSFVIFYFVFSPKSLARYCGAWGQAKQHIDPFSVSPKSTDTAQDLESGKGIRRRSHQRTQRTVRTPRGTPAPAGGMYTGYASTSHRDR